MTYIVKSRNIDFNDKKYKKITIGRFYSNDRYYTLLSEYIDKNLDKQSKIASWIIKVLFRSSNFKHDPGIANGIPLSVKLFDWFCIACLIVAIGLSLAVIGTLIPFITGIVKGKVDTAALDQLKTTLLAMGPTALIFWIPALLWLIIFFAIRRKNKPLTLQAFVEKKVAWCLKLKFLIKNVKNFGEEKNPKIFLLENFDAQGAANVRWLNLQLVNLICSIFPKFNYSFRFETLNEDEHNELMDVVKYDFRKIEIIDGEKIDFSEWIDESKKAGMFNFSKKNKNQEIKATTSENKQETVAATTEDNKQENK